MSLTIFVFISNHFNHLHTKNNVENGKNSFYMLILNLAIISFTNVYSHTVFNNCKKKKSTFLVTYYTN